jgi:hypothetical protein
MNNMLLRGLIRMEKTDYPDAYFDAVSSQYAIEYSEIQATLRELARIIRPGGGTAFVIHSTRSRAVATALEELKAFKFLRHEAPLLTESRRLLRQAVNDRSGGVVLLASDANSRRQRKEFDRLVQRIVEYARSRRQASFVEAIASQVAQTLQQTQQIGPPAALARLHILEQEMSAHQSRLHGIVQAAKDDQGIRDFCDQASSSGFVVSPQPELSKSESDPTDWLVVATRQS